MIAFFVCGFLNICRHAVVGIVQHDCRMDGRSVWTVFLDSSSDRPNTSSELCRSERVCCLFPFFIFFSGLAVAVASFVLYFFVKVEKKDAPKNDGSTEEQLPLVPSEDGVNSFK